MPLQPTTYNLQPRRGFSLIELTISIAILMMITTISIGSYRNGEKRRRVALASDGIISALRLAQNYALAGKQIDASSCGSKAPKDYLVSFSTSSTEYVVYAEDNCSNPLFEIQRYKLPEQTQFRSANGLAVNGAQTPALSVRFTPPYGSLMASSNNGPFVTFTTATASLELVDDSSSSRTVTVDGVSGRIE